MVRIPITIQNKNTWIHEALKNKLDNGVEIIKKNWDLFFLIDGIERSGKSTLGLTCASYLSQMLGVPFTQDNIAKDSKDAKEKLERLPDRSVLLIDEGSLIFSSRDTMKKESKELEKICNVIGQKNMVFIIVLPSFFRINEYLAIDRSRFLLHVYTDAELTRGKFCYFGEVKKRMLYENGKKFKSYSNPVANFTGEFDDFDLLGASYKQIKRDTLFSAFHDPRDKESPKIIKYKARMRILMNMLIHKGVKSHDIQEALKTHGVGVDDQELNYARNEKFDFSKTEFGGFADDVYFTYPDQKEKGAPKGAVAI